MRAFVFGAKLGYDSVIIQMRTWKEHDAMLDHYTLTSYEPVEVNLPKPDVPEHLVDDYIARMLEPYANYRPIAEKRAVLWNDYLVVTTTNCSLDGNPAPFFEMEHSLYHVGSGEMPPAFDQEAIGMNPGETKSLVVDVNGAMAAMPAKLAVTLKVERIVECVLPKLSDEFVAEHFAPSKTIDELKARVSEGFTLPDMDKEQPGYPTIVLNALSQRLVEDVDEADLKEDEEIETLRIMCALDALADHLGIEYADGRLSGYDEGLDLDRLYEACAKFEADGHPDEARTFARREAANAWLMKNSVVRYR